ncbi:MAG: DUF4126 domain-containing protein [Smithellaceae bacterium]
METFLSIAIGIGLAAACGFRVFVPLLILNIAAFTGYLFLPDGFAWMGSPYATIAFAVATVCEILAYYVPWLDNALDTIATPAAMIAGTITSAAVFTDISPFLKWTMALIAGGGIAGFVQASTVLLRGKSLLFTGGAGNPVMSTLELVFAMTLALLALFAPVLALVLVVGFVFWALRKMAKRLWKRQGETNHPC